jgi:acyl CoA:acetate/3-ketoacid CoA transferase alpha subunit
MDKVIPTAVEAVADIPDAATLAERLRATGVGIPAFSTLTGIGTQVAAGGLPWRYAADGSVAVASPPKRTAGFDGSARHWSEPDTRGDGNRVLGRAHAS